MKNTFNDVKELLEESNYTIAKDPAFTVRRYLVTNPKGVVLPIRYSPTMAEMYIDIKKKGIVKFLSEQDASDNVSPTATRTLKARAQKPAKANKRKLTAEDLAATPRALKARREAQEVVASTSMVIDTPQMDMSQEYTSNVVSIQTVRKIDYTKKIPRYFDGYYFPTTIDNMVTRVALGRNVFLQGVAGTGKSELVQKLAKFFDTKIMRINFNTGTTEQHLIGKFVVKDGQTKFVYGLIPLAMKHGWWVLLDEIDYAQPEHLSALQAVLEGNPLLITQNENEEIHPHENFRIFATGNTKGRGDESQSYTGTNFLNIAFLDRWSIFELDYTSQENKICAEYIQDSVFVGQLIQYFKLLRKASVDGELSNASFSTRRLIQICEVLTMGEGLREALTYELWSRYDAHEVQVMEELAYDVWPKEYYFKGKWTIGMPHSTDVTGTGTDATTTAGLLDEVK